MNKRFLKLMYDRYPDIFHDFMVESFYSGIPQDISVSAIEVLNERRVKLEKWLLYQAYTLQRRIPGNPKANDMLFGMLLQIKLIMHMLGPQKREPAPKTTVPIDEDTAGKWLESALSGVKKFVSRETPEKK